MGIEEIFEMGVVIKAVDMFTGPMRKMALGMAEAQKSIGSVTNTMKMMGKSRAEIDAMTSSLNRMGDQKAFANIASDLQRIGMARSEIDAMEGSYMRMAQYQRDMAAAQADYAAGRDLAMSGVGNLAVGAVGAFGIFELVKKAGEFQANMTVIKDSTGASTKQMNDFGDAVMNTSAKVSKFNDMQVSQIAQKLTSGGFSNIKQAQSLLLPVSKYAEVQMYEHKSSDPLQSTQQAIEMAHVFKNYNPKSFENFLNDFNKYSMMQPGDSSSLVQTLTYLAPKAQTLGMSQSDILGLSAVANRVGLIGSHGGTNAADMILRLIPGLVGGAPTKKKTPKAWQAMEDLGFIDKNGNSQFFDKKGKVINLNGMLTTMINDGKKLNPKQLTRAYHDIFGAQGGNAASILANKTTLEQLTQMRAQLGKTKSMEKINADLQKTSEGQMNLLKSNSMTLMLRVGQQLAISLNPAIKKMNEFLGKMLKFSQAHPQVAKLIGDFALFSVGMVTTTGIVKVFAGSFKMLLNGFKMLKLTTEAGELTKFGSILSKVGKFTGISKLGTALKAAFAGIGFTPLILGIAGVAAAGYLIYKNWGTIGPFVKKVWDQVKSYSMAVWKVISPTIISAVKQVWSTLKSTWGGIVSFVKSIWPDVSKIVKTEWGFIGPVISASLKNIWIEIKTMGSIIGSTFKFIWTNATTIIGVAWNLIKDVVKTGWDFISGVIKIGLKLFTGDWSGAWKLTVSTAKTVGGDLLKNFKDLFSGIGKIIGTFAKSAFQWGKDIVNGLIKGVTGMFGNVVSTFKNLGGKVASTFKSVLGIHSPSTVFMEHGKFIVQGLSKGIEQNARLANKSTINLAKGVSGSFNSGNGLSFAGNSGNTHTHYHDDSQITIHPGAIVIQQQPGQDAKSLANEVMKELGKKLRNESFRTGNKPVNAW